MARKNLVSNEIKVRRDTLIRILLQKPRSKRSLGFLIRDGDHCYAIRRVAVHLADSRKVARHLLGEHMANIT